MSAADDHHATERAQHLTQKRMLRRQQAEQRMRREQLRAERAAFATWLQAVDRDDQRDMYTQREKEQHERS